MGNTYVLGTAGAPILGALEGGPSPKAQSQQRDFSYIDSMEKLELVTWGIHNEEVNFHFSFI